MRSSTKIGTISSVGPASLRVLHVLGHGSLGGIYTHVLDLIEAQETSSCAAGVWLWDTAREEGSPLENIADFTLFTAGRSGHDWRLIAGFRNALNSFGPDIVHLHTLPIALSVPLRGFRGPVIYTMHVLPRGWKSALVLRLFRPSIDGVIAVSSYVQSQFADCL